MALDRKTRDSMIQRYADGPGRLRAALATVPPEAFTWRPTPGDWSAHEVICHCADAETVAAARIRYVIAETNPAIIAYDQDAWARTLDYHALPLATALALVDAVRAWTTALLRQLPDDAWSRAGRHTESGHFPAGKWLELTAEHLETHARQIEANATAWQAKRV